MKKIKLKANKVIIVILIIILLIGVGILGLRRILNGNNSQNSSAPFKTDSKTSLLKVGFLTDFEYGTRKRLGIKLTRKAPTEVAKAVIYLNEEFKPDIVVGGGDYIESSAVKPEDALIQLQEINDVFSLVKAPRLYALGNHDLRSLTDAQVREILSIPENHAIRDMGDWRIIVLDTNFGENGNHRNAKSYVMGGVNQDELNWLKEALKTDRPVMIFTHQSPIWVKNTRGVLAQNIFNDKEVRDVLEKADNVVAVFSGHTPTTYFERLNGINYFVADTMVNMFSVGSFATIEATYDSKNKSAKIYFKQNKDKPIEFWTDWKYGEKGEDYKSPQEFPEGAIDEEE